MTSSPGDIAAGLPLSEHGRMPRARTATHGRTWLRLTIARACWARPERFAPGD